MGDRLLRKKELLQRRDDILEQIGAEILNEGHIPAEFAHLPQEFHEMEHIKGQIEERIQPYAHDLERQVAQQPVLEKKLKQLDLRRKNEMSPLVLEFNELNAKLSAPRPEGSPPPLESETQATQARIQELTNRMTVSKAEHQKQRNELKSQIDHLEKKADRLRSEIQKLKDEEDQLEQRKRGLIRDLGYHFYKNRFEDEHFTAKFGQLDLVQQELIDLQHQSVALDSPEPVLPKTPVKRFLIPLVVLVLVVLGFLLFRTRFAQTQLEASDLFLTFSSQGNATFVFAKGPELRKVQSLWPQDEFVPGNLPLIQSDQLEQIFLAQDSVGLAGLGLRYKNNPPPLQDLLKDENWTSKSVEGGFEAWTNGTWNWLILAPNHFLLLNNSLLAGFKAEKHHQPFEAGIRCPFPALGANYPLMEGMDQLFGTFENGKWQLRLSTSQPIQEKEQKRAFLASRSGLSEQVGKCEFEENALEFESGVFLLDDLSITGVKNALASLSTIILGLPPLPATDLNPNASSSEPKALPAAQNAWLLACSLKPQFEVLEAVPLGASIRHIAYEPKQKKLLVADGAQGQLYSVLWSGKNFYLNATTAFTNEKSEITLQPNALILHPEGQICAVLDAPILTGRKAHLALVNTENLSVLWEMPIPAEVTGLTSGTWGPEGKVLYLGTFSQASGNPNGRAMLAYERVGNALQFSRFYDLPFENRKSLVIGSVGMDSRGIFALNLAEGSLVRYDATIPSLLPRQRVRLFPFPAAEAKPIYHLDPNLFVFSREGSQLLVGEYSDIANRHFGQQLYNVDLEAENPILDHSLALQGMAFSILRVPLQDTYWVTHYHQKSLEQLQLDDAGELQHLATFAFPNLSPQHMATDAYGDLMFLSAIWRE